MKVRVLLEFIVITVVEIQQEKIIIQESIKNNSKKKYEVTSNFKLLGEKCSICGYSKCVDALEFHHKNSNEKEFKLGSGNTMSWKDYRAEALKCILVCSNCHKEIHSELGYKF